MFRRIGTVITLIFVFSVGQAVLALTVNSRAMNNEATVTQENQNRREGRRDNMNRRWNRKKHRRHQMYRNDRRHRRNDQRENRNRNR